MRGGIRSRGNGQGTAYKRGATWTAKWSTGSYLDEDGKLRRTVKTKGGFKTKRAALAYASDPPKPTPAAPTLREYWVTYKAGKYKKLSRDKQAAMRKAYERLSSLADIEMDNLTIHQIQEVGIRPQAVEHGVEALIGPDLNGALVTLHNHGRAVFHTGIVFQPGIQRKATLCVQRTLLCVGEENFVFLIHFVSGTVVQRLHAVHKLILGIQFDTGAAPQVHTNHKKFRSQAFPPLGRNRKAPFAVQLLVHICTHKDT